MAAVTTNPQDQALLDYINSVADVASYANALTQITLPVLALPPSWYGDFAQKLAVAKSHALNWQNGVMPALAQVPAAIVNADGLLTPQIAALTSALEALISNPLDSAAEAAASAALASMQLQFEAIDGAVEGLEQSITDFAADLGPDAAALSQLSGNAAAVSGADEAGVQRLNAAIQNLQALINAKKEYATLANLRKGTLGLFLVVVAATVGWLGGPIVDGLLAMGAIATLAGIGDKLKSDADVQAETAQITLIQNEINAVDAEVAVVQATAAQFAQLVTQNTQLQQEMQTIENFWTEPLDQVSQILSDLTDASGSLESNAASALADAEAVAALWSQLLAFSQALGDVKYTLVSGVTMLGSSASSAGGAAY